MLYSVESKFCVKGNCVIGAAKITGPHGVKTVHVVVPIPKDLRMTVSGYGDEVGWFGADIFKAGAKLIKNKVVKKLGDAVRAVVKSDIAAAAVGTLAIAFPPVGVPAAAAFATARTIVTSAEKAVKYADAAGKVAMAIKKDPSAALRVGMSLAQSGNAQTAAEKLLAFGASQGKGVTGLTAAVADAQAKARAGLQAKKVIAETVKRAAAKDPQATKFLKTLVIAKRADKKLVTLKNKVARTRQTPGILVLPSGELLKGSFSTALARHV